MKKQLLYIFAIILPIFASGQITEVVDINTTGSGNPDRIYIASDNKIYFRADNGNAELDTHVWNGSSITTLNSRVGSNDNPNYYIELAGNVYYLSYYVDSGTATTYGNELMRSNGSTFEAVTMLTGTTAGAVSQDNFVTANGKLYLQMNGGDSSTQVWVFDPSLAISGTNPSKIENPNYTGFAGPNNMVSGLLNGTETIIIESRWGVTTSLYLVTLNPATNTYSLMQNSLAVAPLVSLTTAAKNYLLASDGKYYFEGDGPNGDDELWVTDGTPTGTMQLSDINPSGNGDPKFITEHLGNIYFSATNGTSEQLYVYDGTNVTLAATINPTGDATIGDIFSDGTTLYFSATDGTNGLELWKYDGSTASMVKNINTAGDSSPSNFVSLGGTVYFSANDGTGIKLWKTDGSTAGTVSVASLFTTSEDPIDVDEIKIWDNKLVFSATGANGNELFSFDPLSIPLSVESKVGEIINVFPNPASDYITVSKNLLDAPYSIYESTGKLVKEGIITSEKIQLNLTSGLYLVKIKTENSLVTKKIIVK